MTGVSTMRLFANSICIGSATVAALLALDWDEALPVAALFAAVAVLARIEAHRW